MSDVDEIVELVRAAYPDVRCEQLRVRHPGADDDGIWFFTRTGASHEVQIESSNGTCPFLIEHDKSTERCAGFTPGDVAKGVREWLA